MDCFEQVVAKLIEQNGKWIRHNVRINITKEEKRLIGSPNMPRPEIDIVAYDVSTNMLELWEVKSFLDSKGVRYNDIRTEYTVTKGKYKLLTSPNYRKIITNKLKKEWIEKGLIKKDTKIIYGFAIGNVNLKDEEKIKNHLQKRKWLFKLPNDILNELKSLEKEGYEDNLITIVTKIILRGNNENKSKYNKK